MTEPDPQLAAETTWPVLEACLLAGFADDPERVAHVVERVEDLAPADSSRLRARVNSWLARFRYEFTIECAPDGGLHPTRSDAPGRQLRWPIRAEVVDCTPSPAAGRVRVLLRERDGTALVVETDANDEPRPGSWVGVTGTLLRRVVQRGVVVDAPAPEPFTSRAVSKSATYFAEGYLAADAPTTPGLAQWVERAVSRVDARRVADLLVLGLRQAFPTCDDADILLSDLNQILLPAGLFLQRDDDQLALVQDFGKRSAFHVVRVG